MTTYFFLIIVIVAFSYVAERTFIYGELNDLGYYPIYKTSQTRFCLFFIACALIVTSGLRYHVGTDYKSYIALYNGYVGLTKNQLFTLNEPILPIIGKVCGIVFDSYIAMFFVVAVLTIGLYLYSTYKETTDYLFVTLMYIFVGCWHGSFNGIRQYLAVSIIYVGRKYIEERKFIKFAIVCFLAFLVHKSAIFGLALYFVPARKLSVKRLTLVVVGTLVLSRSYEWAFNIIGWLNDSEFMITEYSARSVNVLRVLVGCSPAALGVYYGFTRKLSDEQIFYVYMLVANAATRVVTMGSAYLARLGAFTAIFVPIGLCYLTKETDSRYYKILRWIIIIFYFIYWMYEIQISDTLRNFEWVFSYL